MMTTSARISHSFSVLSAIAFVSVVVAALLPVLLLMLLFLQRR